MDAFKTVELSKMQSGGNKPWREFYDAHESNKKDSRTFEGASIQERYDSEAGDEWKERLSSKVEGREFDPKNVVKREKKTAVAAAAAAGGAAGVSQSGSRAGTPLSRTRTSELQSSRSNSPAPGQSNKPALGTSSLGKKAQNEAYFARMGAENANRPDNVAPNQGGKYSGFGSDPFPAKENNGNVPGMDDFQKDPVAALTKGFGWLSAAVGKGAQQGYEGWVKPGVQKVNDTFLSPSYFIPLRVFQQHTKQHPTSQLAEADLTTQARQTALNIGQGANTAFTRFVEGADGPSSHPSSTSRSAKPEKAEFWDSFGEAPQGPSKDKQDFWDSFGEAPQGPSKEKQEFWDSFGGAGGAAEKEKKGSGNVGTAAMRKTAGAGGAAKKDDEWGEW